MNSDPIDWVDHIATVKRLDELGQIQQPNRGGYIGGPFGSSFDAKAANSCGRGSLEDTCVDV